MPVAMVRDSPPLVVRTMPVTGCRELSVVMGRDRCAIITRNGVTWQSVPPAGSSTKAGSPPDDFLATAVLMVLSRSDLWWRISIPWTHASVSAARFHEKSQHQKSLMHIHERCQRMNILRLVVDLHAGHGLWNHVMNLPACHEWASIVTTAAHRVKLERGYGSHPTIFASRPLRARRSSASYCPSSDRRTPPT